MLPVRGDEHPRDDVGDRRERVVDELPVFGDRVLAILPGLCPSLFGPPLFVVPDGNVEKLDQRDPDQADGARYREPEVGAGTRGKAEQTRGGHECGLGQGEPDPAVRDGADRAQPRSTGLDRGPFVVGSGGSPGVRWE
jgi:hypothetical protein